MKNKSCEYSVAINNKNYLYTLKKTGKTTTYVLCKSANVAQEFLDEDVPDLLRDLPNLILAEMGYKTISNFLRDLALKS